MRQLGRLLMVVVTVVVAYGISVFLFAVADSISRMPSGPLWDESLRVSLRFVLIIIAFIVLLVPAFRTESPATARSQAVAASVIFVFYVFVKLTKVADADVPVHWFFGLLEPLRQWLISLTASR